MDNKERLVVDFDGHLKIFNFLLHIESIGIINKEQTTLYSTYIQDYLRERNSNIEFLESVLKEINNN